MHGVIGQHKINLMLFFSSFVSCCLVWAFLLVFIVDFFLSYWVFCCKFWLQFLCFCGGVFICVLLLLFLLCCLFLKGHRVWFTGSHWESPGPCKGSSQFSSLVIRFSNWVFFNVFISCLYSIFTFCVVFVISMSPKCEFSWVSCRSILLKLFLLNFTELFLCYLWILWGSYSFKFCVLE